MHHVAGQQSKGRWQEERENGGVMMMVNKSLRQEPVREEAKEKKMVRRSRRLETLLLLLLTCRSGGERLPGLRHVAATQCGHTWDEGVPYPPGLGPHLSGPDAAASRHLAFRWDASGCSVNWQDLG